jgi:predicted DNA-binding transcriptional regulator AlpA
VIIYKGRKMNKKMLAVNDVAKILNCARRTIFRFISLQKMPAPLHISNTSMWPAKDIARWIEVGCPSQKTWEVIQGLEEKLKAAKAKAKTKVKKLKK